MQKEFSQCNSNFKKITNGYSKFIYAIYYVKKISRISNENCEIWKKNIKTSEKDNNFIWKKLCLSEEWDAYIENLEILLESLNNTPEVEENLDLSPVSKNLYINTTSPYGNLLLRQKHKHNTKTKKNNNIVIKLK